MAIQTALSGEVPFEVFEAMCDSSVTAKDQFEIAKAKRELEKVVEERAECL